MTLDGLAGDVTRDMVRKHLLVRPSDVVDEPAEGEIDLFELTVRGVATKVTPLTGTNPPDGQVREVALEAICLETASRIEYSLWPDQQGPEDTGRGWFLHQEYLDQMTTLQGLIDEGQAVGEDAVKVASRPRGKFPPAPHYPDPVRVAHRRW